MAPFVLLKSVRFAQLRKSANDAAIDRQRIFSSCDLSAKLNGSSVFLPHLLHCPQGVVNEWATVFQSQQSGEERTMKNFNLAMIFVFGVVLTPGLLIAASEVVIGYANISARVSALWLAQE